MRDKNKGLIPDCSMIKDEIIVSFLKQCWSLNPSERPTFDDIVMFLLSERIQQELRVRIEAIISYLDLIYESVFNSNNKYSDGFKYNILGFKYYFGINVERSQLNAAKYFLISSAYGYPNSMFQYARMRQKGRGILVNKAEALMFYESGALMGNLECMYNLAYMFRDGEGIEKNLEDALFYAEIAADLGDVPSMNLCYTIYLNEIEAFDLVKAFYYLKKELENKTAASFANYSDFILKYSNDSNKLTEALFYMKKAADMDQIESMLKYGYFLWKGIGIKVDKNLSKNYIKRALKESNNQKLRRFILVLTENNKIIFNNKLLYKYIKRIYKQEKVDINIDFTKYILVSDWKLINFYYISRQIEILADNGDDQAMLYYGVFLMFGIGTEINIEESSRYFKMAADKGNAIAMVDYAFSLLPNKVIKNKIDEAIKYIKMAADRNCSTAIYKYALMNYFGQHLPQNKKEAAKYFKMLADKDIKEEIKIKHDYLFQNILDKLVDASISVKCFDLEKPKEILHVLTNMPKIKTEADLNVYERNKILKKLYKNPKFNVLFDGSFPYDIKGDNEMININNEIILNGTVFYLMMLNNGDGIPKDIKQEKKYTHKILNWKVFGSLKSNRYLYECQLKIIIENTMNGNVNAIRQCANILMYGEGVKVNQQKAIKLYKFLADWSDDLDSIIKYAKMLFNGEGIEANLKESIRYFKIAAKKEVLRHKK